MRKQRIERSRHSVEIESAHEQTCVERFAAAARAHEAAKPLLVGSAPLRRLRLEGAERSEIALSLDDAFDAGDAEAADELVLESCDAQVEAESLHFLAREVRTQPGPLERALVVALLRDVTKARKSDGEPSGTKPIDEVADVLRTPKRHDGDAFGL